MNWLVFEYGPAKSRCIIHRSRLEKFFRLYGGPGTRLIARAKDKSSALRFANRQRVAAKKHRPVKINKVKSFFGGKFPALPFGAKDYRGIYQSSYHRPDGTWEGTARSKAGTMLHRVGPFKSKREAWKAMGRVLRYGISAYRRWNIPDNMSNQSAKGNPGRVHRWNVVEKTALGAALGVKMWSPGDGLTRYRFFDLNTMSPDQTYYGPADGLHTALGKKNALQFISTWRIARSAGIPPSNPCHKRNGPKVARVRCAKCGRSIPKGFGKLCADCKQESIKQNRPRGTSARGQKMRLAHFRAGMIAAETYYKEHKFAPGYIYSAKTPHDLGWNKMAKKYRLAYKRAKVNPELPGRPRDLNTRGYQGTNAQYFNHERFTKFQKAGYQIHDDGPGNRLVKRSGKIIFRPRDYAEDDLLTRDGLSVVNYLINEKIITLPNESPFKNNPRRFRRHRLADPKDFRKDTFRTITPKGRPDVRIVLAKRKGSRKMSAQAILTRRNVQ